MSASKTCPLCTGSGFRSTDGGPAHQICECVDLGDEGEDCGFGICEKCGFGFVDEMRNCIKCDAEQPAKVICGWKKYRRSNLAEMRPVVKGEDLEGISISAPDNQLRHDDPAAFDLGFIARNPQNHADQWYVARAYFDANFEAI